MGATAKKQAQAVVELGHGAKGRAYAWYTRTLMQRERRRHMQHFIHLRMLGLR